MSSTVSAKLNKVKIICLEMDYFAASRKELVLCPIQKMNEVCLVCMEESKGHPTVYIDFSFGFPGSAYHFSQMSNIINKKYNPYFTLK